MKKKITILAIETSCDETAAAVIKSGDKWPEILSNIVSSQVDLHAKTGGVVPEVASRAHMESVIPVIEEALSTAKTKIDDITHIAVTAGPGLIGSLLVGFNAAKALSYSRNLPLVPINHIEGHIYSAAVNAKQELENKSPNDGKFPILALTVSGGHSSLTLVEDHQKYRTLGETIDDAAGEAFDKVAKLLDLGYPGGPEVSKLAANFRQSARKTKIEFPRPLIKKPNYNFSFSGLKTAVLTEVKKNSADSVARKEEICFAFEEAVVDVLATKTLRAARKYRPMGLVLAGGVAANRCLQEGLKYRIEKYNSEVEEKYRMNFYLPGPGMSGDNAAMIGLAAYWHVLDGDIKKNFEVKVDSNLSLVNS